MAAVVIGVALVAWAVVIPRLGDDDDDQTGTVQQAIDASCERGGTVQLQGVYRTDGMLEIGDCKDLRLVGPATFDGSKGSRAREDRHLSIRRSKRIVVDGITVVGRRCQLPPCGGGLTENEKQHGFEIAASTDVELRNVVANHVWGDGIYLTGKAFDGGDEVVPEGIVVRDAYINNSGRQGIAPSGVDGILIERTVVRLANRSVFDFEAESGGAANVEIRDSAVIEPDNATVNISCKEDEKGTMLNRGPFVLAGVRVYGDRLKVNPFNCDLPAGLVVLEGNLERLPTSEAPPPPPLPTQPASARS